MKRVQVNASRTYDVVIKEGLCQNLAELLVQKDIARPGETKLFLLCDEIIAALHLPPVLQTLKKAGFSVSTFTIPQGEQQKTMQTLSLILERMAESHLDRNSVLLALGGGVVGDLGGFAASIFLRGIRFVGLPTTLLAAVDSSVGGKTGVDLRSGKNLAGSFWQPSLVVCDTSFLKTLPKQELRCGYGEMVKYAFLKKSALFDRLLSQNPSCPPEESLIAECVAMKRDIVEQDEHDRGQRALLNFGHTPAHAIEALSQYTIKHGVAVAMGIDIILHAYYRKGVLSREQYNKAKALLEHFDLLQPCVYTPAKLAQTALQDKKRHAQTIDLIVPDGQGAVKIEKTPVSALEALFALGLGQEGA